MDYQALYRKYRPQTFEDVIGQTHVTTTLAREVADGHVAHAYLFAGPRGTGKTTTARILAKALNCENRHADGSPDDACGSCVAISEGSSLDVMELDAASHNSVDDIREMRVNVSTVASAGGAKRVFILDEAHMLSKAAGNALLKTLEEPPPGVHFVLATTEPYKLLDTIRSRSQRFDFHAVSVETLAAHLARIADAEGLKTDTPALVAISRHAMGSVRDSLSLLEQVAALGDGAVDVPGVNRALGLADHESYERYATAIADQDARAGLELIATLASQGVDLRRFAAETLGFLRGVFLAHYAPNLAEISDEPEQVRDGWRRAASRIPASDVLRAIDVMGEALVKLREGREERLMLELATIRVTRPETSSDTDALRSRLDRIELQLRTGAAGAQAAPAPSARTDEVRATPIPADPAPTATLQPAGPDQAGPDEAGDAAASDQGPEQTQPDDAASEDLDAVMAEAAAPLVDEDAAAEPRPPAAVTMEKFESVWPQLFGGLRDLLGNRRWALFRETEPLAVENGTLIIGVRHHFHLTSLNGDPAVKKLVTVRAGDLLGGSVQVEFRASTSAAAKPAEEIEPEEDPTVDKDRMAEAPSETHDPTSLIERELGGTVIEDSNG